MLPGSRIKIHGKEFILRRKFTSSGTANAKVKGNIILVKIPRRCQREEGFRIFLELAKKIIRKMEKHPEKIAPVPLEFKNGQKVSVLGKKYHISVHKGYAKSSSARLDGQTITIKLARGMDTETEEKHVSNLARRVISRSVLPLVRKRADELNRTHFPVSFRKLFLKAHTSLWGSCSEKGNINLNFRLLFAPEGILDYVIVHELAHMKEKNHSPAFWSLVEKAVPDYKERRKWLKENGNRLTPSSERPDTNGVCYK